MAELCRLIESAEQVPTLEELAEHAGLSAYHLHRVFKSVTGLTPKEYAAAHRTRRVREELGRSSSITEAIYGAGYGSNGRFYESSNQVLGMTPTSYRAGGANTEIRFAIGSGIQTINVLTPLPAIVESLTIDGTTQPGFAGSPIIELNGSSRVTRGFIGFPTIEFNDSAGLTVVVARAGKVVKSTGYTSWNESDVRAILRALKSS